MKKAFFISFFSLVLGLLNIQVANAQSCDPVYGAGLSCVTTGGLVLDLTATPQGSKFQPNSNVNFQIKLTNVTTATTMPELEVKQAFPPYVDYVESEGSFDSTTRILTLRVMNLEPNQSKTYTITGKIADADKLPGKNSRVCVVTQATAIVLDPASSKDTLQFCIEKKQASLAPIPATLPIKSEKKGFPVLSPPANIAQTPSTGNEALIVPALISMGLLGLILRKKTGAKFDIE